MGWPLAHPTAHPIERHSLGPAGLQRQGPGLPHRTPGWGLPSLGSHGCSPQHDESGVCRSHIDTLDVPGDVVLGPGWSTGHPGQPASSLSQRGRSQAAGSSWGPSCLVRTQWKPVNILLPGQRASVASQERMQTLPGFRGSWQLALGMQMGPRHHAGECLVQQVTGEPLQELKGRGP